MADEKGKRSSGVPDSVFEDFELLEEDLKRTGGKKMPQQLRGGNSSFDDSSWEILLSDPLGGVEVGKLAINEVRQLVSSSLYDEFFSPDEPVLNNQFRRENNDPTYLIDLNRRKAKKKLLDYFSFEMSIFSSSEVSNKGLSLTDSEHKDIVSLLGLPEGISYSEKQLIEAGRKLIMAELKISEEVKYNLNQVLLIAKKSDDIFAPYIKDVFEGISTENFFNIFEVSDATSFDALSVFSFCMMSPENRSTWVVSRFRLKPSVRAQMLSLLGIYDNKKYSIEDIKSIADFYDTNGRKGSGIIRILGHMGYDSVPVFEKKYTVDEVIRFVLFPPKGRDYWITLQRK